ncbi:MAG: hypothetical protein IPI79_05950 [Moraxellaceae bacterium]|nr:hypothetical protein [Moraxellaceae bacterium]
MSNDIEAHNNLANSLWFGHLATNRSWSELGALSEWHKYVAAKLQRVQIIHEKLSETYPLLANNMSPAAYSYLMEMFSVSIKKIDLSID